MKKMQILALALILAAGPSSAWSQECRGCDAAKEVLDWLEKDAKQYKPSGPQVPGETFKFLSLRRAKNVVTMEFEYTRPDSEKFVKHVKKNKVLRDEIYRGVLRQDIESWCGDPARRNWLSRGVIIRATVWYGTKKNLPIAREVSYENCSGRSRFA